MRFVLWLGELKQPHWNLGHATSRSHVIKCWDNMWVSRHVSVPGMHFWKWHGSPTLFFRFKTRRNQMMVSFVSLFEKKGSFVFFFWLWLSSYYLHIFIYIYIYILQKSLYFLPWKCLIRWHTLLHMSWAQVMCCLKTKSVLSIPFFKQHCMTPIWKLLS